MGLNFLKNFALLHRIIDHPFGYQDLRSGIRRALTLRFPYAVYFSVERETIESNTVVEPEWFVFGYELSTASGKVRERTAVVALVSQRLSDWYTHGAYP